MTLQCPVYVENVSEEAFHLFGMMMSLYKAERPATSEALRYGVRIIICIY